MLTGVRAVALLKILTNRLNETESVVLKFVGSLHFSWIRFASLCREQTFIVSVKTDTHPRTDWSRNINYLSISNVYLDPVKKSKYHTHIFTFSKQSFN